MINRVYTVSEHLYFSGFVEIQTNISDKGLPVFEISGLVSKSVEESKKRVLIALENSGFSFPLKNILVNLAPASLTKSGTHYDLPIAVSIIKERLSIPIEKSIFIGELSFDGGVRPVENIFYLVISAIEAGFKHIYVPSSCIDSLLLFDDVKIYPLKSLQDLNNLDKLLPLTSSNFQLRRDTILQETTYPRIRGNYLGKRAIAYSLIGNHHILIQGFPGLGKSMLVKSMIDLSPDLTEKEIINVSKMYSYAGFNTKKDYFSPPFRNPHPLSSYSSIFGSFSNKLVPGEVTLANKGVLFLDELPEFNRLVIEGLRTPLEDKKIQLSRTGIKAVLESDFLLAATANPCKCGYFNHPRISCTCSPIDIRRYQSKISGPILDRIDIKLKINENSRIGDSDYNKYPNLEYSNLKRLIHEKRVERRNLLKIEEYCKNNEINMFNNIVHNYFPVNMYNILNNELKDTSISDRSKIKLVNLIFTICIFNNRTQIVLEDVLEGLSLTVKSNFH